MGFVQVVLLAINPYIFYNQSVITDILSKSRKYIPEYPGFVSITTYYEIQRQMGFSEVDYLSRELRRYKHQYVNHGGHVETLIGEGNIQIYYAGLFQPDGIDLFKLAVDTNFVPQQELMRSLLIFMFNLQSNKQAMEYLLDTYLYLYLPTLPVEIESELMDMNTSMNISCSRPWFDGEVVSLTRGFRYKIEINRAKNIFIFDTLHYLITTQDLDLSENPAKFEKLLTTIKEVGANINWPYLFKKATFYRTNNRYKELVKAIYAATKYFPIDFEQRNIILHRNH